mgnify:CR=1 FL=1
MLARMLVPLDGSVPGERALPFATRLARSTGAHLYLLHVLPKPFEPRHPWIDADVAARLEDLARLLRGLGLQATARTVVSNEPSEAILDAAVDPPADLIVMSTHGRSGIGRWLYGSVADAVLRGADAPVLLIPATSDHPWPEDRPLKILVPLDGSDHSEAALEPAHLLRQTLSGELLLLRVVDKSDDVSWRFDPVAFTMREVPPMELEHAQEYLTTIASAAGADTASVGTFVEVGDPASAISRVARQEGVDLIVMATHGRTGLARLTLGSVATATLQRAHVPVLLVRPAALASAAKEVMSRREERIDEAAMNAWPPVGTRG